MAQTTRLTSQPTLEEIKSWPAAVNVAPAADAFGVSRSLFYELIERGECPARVIKVGNRLKVVTASILDALAGGTSAAGQ